MKIFYFSSTHWDREWYQSFQGFRKRLVETTVEICDHMLEDPGFGVFHFDGQTIVLEDVFEIRPDLKEKIQRLIDDKRLMIGPWYVMPDEFLPSGESLIRNLMLGHRISEQYNTSAWKFGYICDIFGHIAQMPQIFNGFDIKYSLLGRGTNEHTTEPFFCWESPDGSDCLTVKLYDRMGYGDFNMSTFGLGNTLMPEEEFKRSAKEYLNAKIKGCPLPLICLMDGIDHAPIHRHTSKYIRWLQDLYPDAQIKHDNLCKLGEELEKFKKELKIKKGELIEPAKQEGGYLYLITNTLSSHYPLKKHNDLCQVSLERIASPIMALSHLSGSALEKGYYDLAWKYLLQNHAHDSICGCSIDQVHKDMIYRFDQAKELCNEIVSDFIARDMDRIAQGKMPEMIDSSSPETDGKLTFRLFNSLPFDREQTVSVDIDFPLNYSASFAEPFGYQKKNSFVIKDEAGNCLKYRITEIKRNSISRYYRYHVKTVDRLTVTMKVSLKSMGWTTFTIEHSERPVRYLESQIIGNLKAENEFLSLKIKTDGTFDVFDKRCGIEYQGFNLFVSDGEIGDGWYHASEVGSPVRYSSEKDVRITVKENSPNRTVFSISKSLSVPEEMIYEAGINEEYRGIHPSKNRADIEIETEVILDAASPLIGLEITINNTAKDHRLRLLIPTGIRGDWFAYQTFYFTERKAHRSFGVETATWKEMEPVEKNFNGITGKRDKEGRGIAFFSAYGLHEAGTYDDEEGSIFITLLRSFRRTVQTDGEEQAQIQGRHSFKTALYFMEKEVPYGEIHNEYLRFSTPLISYTLHAFSGDTMKEKSMLKLSGKGIVLSTVKVPENEKQDTVIVRMINLSDRDSTASIEFSRAIEDAQEVNLNEEKRNSSVLKINGRELSLPISKWKIKTIEVKLGRKKPFSLV